MSFYPMTVGALRRVLKEQPPDAMADTAQRNQLLETLDRIEQLDVESAVHAAKAKLQIGRVISVMERAGLIEEAQANSLLRLDTQNQFHLHMAARSAD